MCVCEHVPFAVSCRLLHWLHVAVWLGVCVTQIEELGAALLFQLSNADGPLVDNVALIDVLQATKTASADIEAKHESGRDATRIMDGTRAAYNSVATRGAVLFLAGSALSNMLPSYQLSFGRFLHLFRRALQRSPSSRATEQRYAWV